MENKSTHTHNIRNVNVCQNHKIDECNGIGSVKETKYITHKQKQTAVFVCVCLFSRYY